MSLFINDIGIHIFLFKKVSNPAGGRGNGNAILLFFANKEVLRMIQSPLMIFTISEPTSVPPSL